MNIKLVRKVVLFSAVLVTTGSVRGNTFAYTNGNVLICFRKANPTTYASLGGNDLVVNAGPINYFTNLAPNTKVTITAYTGGQLGQVATNSVGWSTWAYFDEVADPTATNTLFMTKPRTSLNNQTAPYNIRNHNSYGYVIGELSAIVQGAMDNAGYSPYNSSLAVLESDSWNESEGLSLSYYNGLGTTFDFNGSFQADPEQYNPANFTTSGNPLRSDFYWLYPSSASNLKAVFLGYFELSTNGVMTYTAYPTPTVVAPTIISFTRTGSTSTVTFTTGNSGTYTLRGTNSLTSGTPSTNWPSVTSVAGDGSNHSLSDITTSTNKFYIITAQ
jgi:hypothetical protein